MCWPWVREVRQALWYIIITVLVVAVLQVNLRTLANIISCVADREEATVVLCDHVKTSHDVPDGCI